jgi:hypothetical protein
MTLAEDFRIKEYTFFIALLAVQQDQCAYVLFGDIASLANLLPSILPTCLSLQLAIDVN